MPRSGLVLALALAAGVAACSNSSPDEEAGSSAGAPATLNDSLATGEAIQTVPPPVESAEPTATATGDTLSQSSTDTTRRP